ncbi:amidohydrolase family protein [Corallococcus sp. M34]|uniref:amidohydrolase n=1 Tax=Citreicoccus inhibens TaxID=2849499 RepID=UPI001C2482BA|nr:amidohydrolase family protein [Citreicoccus inhibens]MBU8897762.1 amidohydrolase family protein [Citreicoccus inhibens]
MHHTRPTCTHCGCNNPLMERLGKELLATRHFGTVTGIPVESGPQLAQGLLIHGGIIRPMIDGSTEMVEAIGLHGGRVVATGKREKVEEAMQRLRISYLPVQLKPTETLLPGLIEPHVHIVASAMMAGFTDMGALVGQSLRPDYNAQWLTELIQSKAAEIRTDPRRNDWVLGREVDPAMMPFTVNPPGQLNHLQLIDSDFLDQCVSDIPVLLMSASLHTAYLNTPALKLTYENTPTLQALFTTFDAYKESNHGQLQEIPAMRPALEAIPKHQVDDIKAELEPNLTRLFDTAVERGVTMLYDAGLTTTQLDILKAYLKLHKPGVRIGGALAVETAKDVRESLGRYEAPLEYDDLYIGHLKVISDGSNQGLTGYQSTPYCCEPPDNRGNFNYPKVGDSQPATLPSEFAELVQTAVSQNWSMMIHANGDTAVEFTTQAYTAALKRLTPEELLNRRDRIEHCSLVNSTQLGTMARWGITPSFLIGHVGYWGFAFNEAILGKERAQSLTLCKSALDHGLRISLHCDYAVTPLGPLREMEQAITRIMEADPSLNALNEDECLTPEQALRAITHDAAWHCRAEHWFGSLKAGHHADFVILEQDPLSLGKQLPGRGHGNGGEQPPLREAVYQRMRAIKVLSTWKGGVKVYAAKS